MNVTQLSIALLVGYIILVIGYIAGYRSAKYNFKR